MDEYLEEGSKPSEPCECFEEEQEFIMGLSKIPEKFYVCCPWAWADIYEDILSVASGVNIFGLNQSGTVITSCTDWFRPVIFKIERLDLSNYQ